VAEVLTVGVWVADVKPSGPVHAYDAMPEGPPFNINVEPAHTGPLLPAVATGKALTTTVVVAGSEVHTPLFTVRV
jgi:hypothetical protein